jgi:phosphatidylinositol glycan class K
MPSARIILRLLGRVLLLLPIVPTARSSSSSPHQENYAVIVSSSRYWFNYRHTVNALTLYHMLTQQGGFTDDRIILMLADEYAINARNPYKNVLTSATAMPGKHQANAGGASTSLYEGDSIEIDYRGEDVTVENLARVLSGRQRPGSSLPVLPADVHGANVFLYLTGHGGDGFFKFQDVEEILAADLTALVQQRSFHQFLFLADTCQAFTLADDRFKALPAVSMVGSSLRDESSYAHHSNVDLGLAMIERYTYAMEQFLRQKSWASLGLYEALVAPFSYESQRAHVGFHTPAVGPEEGLFVGDFFLNRQAAEDSPPRAWPSHGIWRDWTTAIQENGLVQRQSSSPVTRYDGVEHSDDSPAPEGMIPPTWWGALAALCLLSIFSRRR